MCSVSAGGNFHDSTLAFNGTNCQGLHTKGVPLPALESELYSSQPRHGSLFIRNTIFSVSTEFHCVKKSDVVYGYNSQVQLGDERRCSVRCEGSRASQAHPLNSHHDGTEECHILEDNLGSFCDKMLELWPVNLEKTPGADLVPPTDMLWSIHGP